MSIPEWITRQTGGTAPATNFALTRLRAFPERIVTRLQQHIEARLRITRAPRSRVGATADENYVHQQRMVQELETERQSVLQEIAGFRAEAETLERDATSEISRQLDRPAPTESTEALLRQGAQRDAWARMRPLLDQVEPVALNEGVKDLANEALALNDDDALSALRRELPAYVRLRAGSKDLGEQLTPVVGAALDEAIAAARPAASVALQAKREIETGMPRLHAAFGQAEQMVKSGDTGAVIPAWDRTQPDHIVQSAPVDHPI